MGEPADSAESTPMIPVGLDAYRHWQRWPYQRIGARAYMRSTYDRAGGNETADASHFLYQLAEDFNVTLDVEGAGVLYFKRTNHWHGSPWHYEVDGTDHVVSESTTADPTRRLTDAVFLPEHLFPHPLTWTYSQTHGADLMWVPIPFERRMRLAYSRTFYGTGYYIYHLYDPAAPLSQPIRGWDGRTPPDPGVLELLHAAGSDIAPRPDDGSPPAGSAHQRQGTVRLTQGQRTELLRLTNAPAMVRALEFSAPRDEAAAFGRAALRIRWDDRQHPSVDAPLALLFGSGTLHNRDGREYLVRALPVHIRFTPDRVHLACYFPMPYFRSAHIELQGAPDRTLDDVQWSLRTVPYTDPANHVGYFHATYRDHADPTLGQDNVFLDTQQVEGGGDWSGSFIGTSFIFTERGVLTTLEGDPRFFFDDSRTPQAQGTGTEEWGGGGDYWGGRNMTIPLAGHPVGTRTPDEAVCPEELIHSAYRFLLADLMPFGKRAVIRFEHGGTNQSREHYRSVTYWYGLPAASLVQTDELDVGDPASEQAHQYSSPQAGSPYSLTSRYEWGIDTLPAGSSAQESVLARPRDLAEFEFEADAATYTIWVRGKTSGNLTSDATWFQFDDRIGTAELAQSYAHSKGFGNWRDDTPAGVWSWSSALPQDPPQTVTFRRRGLHRLRVQLRHAPHRIDQIWLSTSRTARPTDRAPIAKPESPEDLQEIVLDAGNAQRVAGSFRIVDDPTASTGKALEVGGAAAAEVYPAHTEIGRRTAGTSEFTLRVRPDNFGVLLRRTLDYAYPNQRAEVYVADAEAAEPDWQHAGVWYLAGSNTWYHSYPRQAGELGASQPVVKTSNRRFRDDEFLISRALTRGRSALRVRVVFTPVEIPLLPGRELGELAWSEIRYTAYCWVLPEFTAPAAD